MTTPDYDGSKIAPKLDKGQIRITREYWLSLNPSEFDQGEQAVLETRFAGQSICPAWLWFEDSPVVRQLLKCEDIR